MKKILATVMLMVALHCSAETLTGRVVAVADGDSITVLDCEKVQHKIRLGGIDAPELQQPYGRQATEFLMTLFWASA